MTKNSNNLKAIGIFLIIGLLALNVYQWYSNSQLSSELNAQKANLFELEKVQTELEQDYQTALEDLEGLRGDNEGLNQLIEEQKNELTVQKNKISGLIWTKGELKTAKKQLAELNLQAEAYINEIRELKESNEFLNTQNTKLSQDNQLLSTNLEETKKMAEELDAQKTSLTEVKNKLEKSNTMLGTKVDMAEAIKLNSISVEGYSVNDDGKAKKKNRAKKTDMLRTCILTETNMVTSSGKKKFKIRFVDPTGNTLALDNAGSGVLTEKLSGKDYRYSTSGTMDYNNEDAEACFDWNPGMDFIKGKYQVQVFNNDFLVGEGEFQLK